MRASLLLSIVAFALPAAEWKSGKLVDLQIQTLQSAKGKPAHSKIFVYSVDAGDKVYQAQEVKKKAPHVEVNAPIEYAVSKDRVTVKDSDGKTHKLTLMKTTRKP